MLIFLLLAFVTTLLTAGPAAGEPLAVRHAEGLTHGFLTLRTLDGKLLATGDLVQNVRGDRVTSRLTFHFTDGSVQDETTVFTQRGTFRLISDHLVQKGSTFSQPLEMSIDAASGRVEVRYRDDKGAEKVESEQLDLPADVSNGMMQTLLKNVAPGAAPPTLSYVAPTPKPRLVKLAISTAGVESFSVAGSSKKAAHYVIKMELGGVAGVVAPIIGKQPPDTHVWILGGDAPAFIKSQGPMSNGGDPWRIELASPAWPKQPALKR